MDTMLHLRAIALDTRAAVRAAELGITELQARRMLQSEEILNRRVRRQWRDL